MIVLSHGHWDHVDGDGGARPRRSAAPSLPVMIHPEFWSRRRISFPGRAPAELPADQPRRARGDGLRRSSEERQPSFLLDGAVLITGEVDRTTPFETGFAGHEALRDGRLARRTR